MLTFFLQSFVKEGENPAEKVSELSFEKGEEIAKVR